jgi:hypothetical protein
MPRRLCRIAGSSIERIEVSLMTQSAAGEDLPVRHTGSNGGVSQPSAIAAGTTS